MNDSVGIIGVGLLGTALAERLLKAGFSITGYDSDESCRKELSRLGGTAVETIEEIPRRCQRILLSLPDSTITTEVAGQITGYLQPGTFLLDTTTGHPDEMAELQAHFAKHNCHYFDTTICGSSEQTRQGEIVLLAGSTETELAPCRDILESLTNQIFYLNQPGSAARMKLVVNLVLGLNRAVLAEGLTFAESLGLNPEQTLEILQAGPAASTVMETKGQKMVTGDFTPQARLSQHYKDVLLILEQGKKHGAVLPMTAIHQAMLRWLLEVEAGDQDNSAIIQAFRPNLS